MQSCRPCKGNSNQIDSEANFLAWELRPSVLDDLDLVPALKNFVRDWSKHFNIAAEFEEIGLDGKKLGINILDSPKELRCRLNTQ